MTDFIDDGSTGASTAAVANGPTAIVMCNGLWCRNHGPEADEYRAVAPGADVRTSHCLRACFFPPVVRVEDEHGSATFFAVRDERADQVLHWIAGDGDAPAKLPPLPPLPRV